MIKFIINRGEYEIDCAHKTVTSLQDGVISISLSFQSNVKVSKLPAVQLEPELEALKRKVLVKRCIWQSNINFNYF